MRGEVHRFRRRDAAGRELAGHRYAVVVQATVLDHLSTWVVVPTSTTTAAAPAVFRPEITLLDEETRVLCEQLTSVDPQRLGRSVAFLSLEEMQRVDRALRLLLDLGSGPVSAALA